MAKVLRYRGTGEHFVGVPARDLTDDDIAALSVDAAGTPWTAERLLDSGLYVKVGGNPDALKEAEHERAARVRDEARATAPAMPAPEPPRRG